MPTTPGNAKVSKHQCNPELAQHIESLRALLKQNYGFDFAFTISGNGHILAASSLTLGIIIANPTA
jgi:hypothetical protein